MYNRQIENLNYLADSGILSKQEAIEKIFIIKEKAVKDKHKYTITKRNNGRYITKIKYYNKTVQLSASTYEQLIDKIYSEYFDDNITTLEKLYPLWIEYRKNVDTVTDKTIRENMFLWNKYLEGQSITKEPLYILKSKDYSVYFRTITKGRQLTRKKYNDIKSIMNGIIYYAIELEIIDHNPIREIKHSQYPFKPTNNEIIPYTEDERRKILNALPDDDIYSLAIKLFFHLVLRIGELRGLRFDDICNNQIHIQRFVNDKNQVIQEIKGHQSSGFRWQPLTDECKKIIENIKKINPDSEYMFTNNGNFIAICTFNRRLKNTCSDLDIRYLSSHKIRFSVASILYKNGLSLTELQYLLGHSDLKMTTHYLRNITHKDETFTKICGILG